MVLLLLFLGVEFPQSSRIPYLWHVSAVKTGTSTKRATWKKTDTESKNTKKYKQQK